MKVAVITRHAVTNYGALLQAVATQQTIENLGHSCEIINYIRKDETYRRFEFTLLKGKKEWSKNPLKKAVYLALRLPQAYIAGRKFEKERGKKLHLTPRYSSLEQLENNLPEADVYMTGSDQVWGPVADGSYDSAYCLSFVPKEKRKIAYASSFGRAALTEETKAYYKKWLSRYEKLAVRENSAVDLLKDFGLKASQVVDPTLLLDASYWNRYVTKPKTGKYVLVYQLHNNPAVGEYAEKVAKAMKLPLIRISPTLHQCTRPGKLDFTTTVEKALTYIKNAECLITDSFHGTVFAMTYHTPFVEVLPNNGTGTRNVSLLQLTGLSDRIVYDPENVALASQPIDYERVDAILRKERERSLAILKDMLD